MVGGPALGREDARDGVAIAGVGADAVDRLGRKRNEIAGEQRLDGARDGLRLRLRDRSGRHGCKPRNRPLDLLEFNPLRIGARERQ